MKKIPNTSESKIDKTTPMDFYYAIACVFLAFIPLHFCSHSASSRARVMQMKRDVERAMQILGPAEETQRFSTEDVRDYYDLTTDR